MVLMTNFQKVLYYGEEGIEFSERELKLKSLFVEIDRMIGSSCDFESMVDEKEMTIDEMKSIVIDSLEGYIDEITELEDIEKYQRYITRVENI
jgi:hypothetical protein